MPVHAKHHRRYARRLTLLFAVLSSSLLAGCAVGPDYEQPVLHIPGEWSNADSHNSQRPAQLSQWWTRLGDPLLNALVSQAIEVNLSIEMAKARVREARAFLREEAGNLLPTGDGVVSANRSRIPAGDNIPASTSSEYRAGFDASWEVDLFGRHRRTVEGAQYGLDTAEEDLRNSMLVLIGDVVLNYSLARAYQARTALAQRGREVTTRIGEAHAVKVRYGHCDDGGCRECAGAGRRNGGRYTFLRNRRSPSYASTRRSAGQAPFSIDRTNEEWPRHSSAETTAACRHSG